MKRGRPLKPAREEAMRVICWLLALALAAAAPLAGYADVTPLRIAFLSDMSGPNADLSGVGSVEAGHMAIEDFGGRVLGRPVEIALSATISTNLMSASASPANGTMKALESSSTWGSAPLRLASRTSHGIRIRLSYSVAPSPPSRAVRAAQAKGPLLGPAGDIRHG
jgi:hypothetical protein